jgi:Arylsulfotransferase (ASST)/Arylsulfotransferase Ig-like domain
MKMMHSAKAASRRRHTDQELSMSQRGSRSVLRAFLKSGVLFAGMFVLAAAANLEAAISITLTPSTPSHFAAAANSSAPLGTIVHWSTSVNDTGAGALCYRFRSAEQTPHSRRTTGEVYQTIVDYGPNDSLDWTEMDHEGAYAIEASVEDTTTGETATTVVPFTFTTRLTDANTPAISPTNNPLVFLYSAPGCKEGGQMLVQFQSPGGVVTKTPYQACHSRTSMNFYLAGMRAQTTYQVRHTLVGATGTTQGPAVTLTTGSITITPPSYNVYMPPSNSSQGGVLLQCGLEVPTLATDLAGNVVWYYTGPITLATRALSGGYFLGIYENTTTDPSHEYFVKFDLAGNILLETNAARVNQQLAAMGRNPIDAFHHEARELPNGGYLVLADTERILTNVQGPGPVDVIGDEILALGPNLEVLWTLSTTWILPGWPFSARPARPGRVALPTISPQPRTTGCTATPCN